MKKELFGWLMASLTKKGEWRYVMMVCGAASVMKDGTGLMHTSSANSWDMLRLVRLQ